MTMGLNALNPSRRRALACTLAATAAGQAMPRAAGVAALDDEPPVENWVVAGAVK